MSSNKQIKFQKTEAAEMATFVAGLEKEGMVYIVYNDDDGWRFELTGGY
jgi:hypothetical protein